jgi:hypothetical protein
MIDRQQSHSFINRLPWSAILKVLALLSLVVAVTWAFASPGFESLLAFLGGTAALITAFAIDSRANSSDVWETEKISVERLEGERSRLLTRVKMYWIDSVLNNALRDAVWIELGLTHTPEMLRDPFNALYVHYDRKEVRLDDDTDILSLFRDSQGSLLILGAPGAGKTTTLLKLADQLLSLAQGANDRPVPVIFNLSSWAEKRTSLADWLVSEMVSSYNVSRPVSRRLVSTKSIIPLLDGLDEVRLDARKDCIGAINQFLQDFGLPEIVVCSRLIDYEQLTVRLQLNAAVRIHPLTVEQIDRYLAYGGERLGIARTAVANDKALQELASAPLFLNIIALAYRDVSAYNADSSLSENALRRNLFDHYVWRTLHQRGMIPRKQELSSTVNKLSWLAQQMKSRSQTVFYIERLQPAWLNEVKSRTHGDAERLSSRIFLYLLLSRLLVAAYIAITAIASFNLALILLISLGSPKRYDGTLAGIIAGCGVAIGTLLVDSARVALHARHAKHGAWPMVAIGFSYSLAIGLCTAIVTGLFGEIGDAVLLGLTVGIIYGLFFVSHGYNVRPQTEIKVYERLTFSPKRAVNGLIPALAIGLLTGYVLGWARSAIPGEIASDIVGSPAALINGILWGLITLGQDRAITLALIFGVAAAIVYGILSGLTGGETSIGVKTTPNQGIHLSIRNALFVGVIVTLGVGAFFGGLILLTNDFQIAVVGASMFGLFSGSLAALWNGGMDAIRHYSLRLLLIINGHISWKYVSILNQAADRLLLRRVGGGYIFIHQYLQDYFAEQEPDATMRSLDRLGK